MVQAQSIVKVLDDRGVLTCRCLGVIGGSLKGKLGDFVSLSVQSALAESPFVRGTKVRGVIVELKRMQDAGLGKIQRSENGVVLLNPRGGLYSVRNPLVISSKVVEFGYHRVMREAGMFL